MNESLNRLFSKARRTGGAIAYGAGQQAAGQDGAKRRRRHRGGRNRRRGGNGRGGDASAVSAPTQSAE